MCPEMAQKKDHLGGAADIWALGVILYILLTGKMPFHGAFEDDLFRKISSGKYRWPDFLSDEKGKEVEISILCINSINALSSMLPGFLMCIHALAMLLYISCSII